MGGAVAEGVPEGMVEMWAGVRAGMCCQGVPEGMVKMWAGVRAGMCCQGVARRGGILRGQRTKLQVGERRRG